MFDFIAKLFGGGRQEEKKKRPAPQLQPFNGPFRNAEFARQNAVQQAALGRRSLNPQLLNAPVPTARPQFQVPTVRPTQVLPSRVQPVRRSNPIESLARIAAGSNEKFFGEGARGLVTLANTLGGDLLRPNQAEIDKKTNDFLRSTGQITNKGTAPLSQGINRSLPSFKVGEALGTGQKIAADIVTAAIPGAAAEKSLRAAMAARNIAQGASRAQRATRALLPVVGGGAVTSGISQAQNTRQNAGENFATGAAIDAASTLLGPIGSAIAKAVQIRKVANNLPDGRVYTNRPTSRLTQTRTGNNRNEPPYTTYRNPRTVSEQKSILDTPSGRSYGIGQTRISDASQQASSQPRRQTQVMSPRGVIKTTPENLPYRNSRIEIYGNDGRVLAGGQPSIPEIGQDVLRSQNLLPESLQRRTPRPVVGTPQLSRGQTTGLPDQLQNDYSRQVSLGPQQAGRSQELRKTKELPSENNTIKDRLREYKLLRNRGFLEQINRNPNLLPQEIVDLYKVRNTKELQIKSANLAKESPDIALEVVRKGADDAAVAVASELIKRYQKEGNYELAIDVAETIAPKLTEAGRAVQAASIYGKLTPEGALRFAQRQLDKYNEIERRMPGGKKDPIRIKPDQAKKIKELSEKVQDLPEGDAKNRAIFDLTQATGEVVPSSFADKFSHLWRAGLLSSPRTILGGVIGNTTKLLGDIPSQAIGAGIDRFITSKRNGGVRSNVFTLKGSLSGSKEGLEKGKDYFKTGFDERDAAGGRDLKQVNFNSKAGQAAGNVAEKIYRSLGVLDSPFYYSAYQRALSSEALMAAENANISAAERSSFIDEFVKDAPEEAREAAIRSAQAAVFQNPTALGELAARLKNSPESFTFLPPIWRKSLSLTLNLVLPFSRIPGAVATELINYTPIGAVGEAVLYRAGETSIKDLQNAIGKSTVGVGAIALGFHLLNNGKITLEEPSDERERQLWKLENKKPFSVKVGDRWYGLNYLQPGASALAIGAGMARANNEGEPNPVGAGVSTAINSLAEQSFLSGVGDIVKEATESERYGGQFVANLAGSTVPNIVRDLARATDDKEREYSKDPLTQFKAGIPGLRQTNIAERDPFGQPVDRKQSAVGVFLDPFKSTQERTDPVTSELQRLYNLDKDTAAVPSKLKASQSLGGSKIKLTPEQLDKLEGTAGPATKQALDYLIKQPSYQKLSDEDKNRAIRRAIDNTRFNARKELASSETFKDKMGNTVRVNPDSLGKFRTPVGPITGSATTARKESSLPEGRPERSFLDAASALSKEDRTKWESQPVSKDYEPLIKSINQIKPKDLPALPSTNAVAELYSKFQERKEKEKWSPLQTQKESGRLLRDGYKTMLTPDQRFLSTLSDSDIVTAARTGQIKKADLDTIVALDEVFGRLGLGQTIGKRARSSLGYSGGYSRSSSGGTRRRTGSKGGRRRVGFKAPAKSKYNRVASTSAIRKLLSNAKVTRKGKS